MGAGYHLNQASPLLHSIDIGDSLWAFTRNKDKRYILAAELVIKAKTQNPPNFRYGRFRVWGDIKHSRYFVTEQQPSVELVLRNLSCTINSRVLGQSFQGRAAVKSITQEDHLLLLSIAKDLPLDSRARILPEERLEAILLLGDPESISRLIVDENPGMAERRRNYLYKQVPSRNPRLAGELQEMYDGRCQICLWHPRQAYKDSLCHSHHIQWLSRGGDDVLGNLALVCPNHHAAIHRLDAPLDYADMAFVFDTQREKLMANVHLGS
jgi:5-methylcytosine-specific restriction enzyme A